MAEARLYTAYKKEIHPKLKEEFGLENNMAVPKLQKVVINVGVGEAIDNTKILDTVTSNVAAITGQQPITTKAKKSISNFKLREGMPIGAKVTLRGARMYEFLDNELDTATGEVRSEIKVPEGLADGPVWKWMALDGGVLYALVDWTLYISTRHDSRKAHNIAAKPVHFSINILRQGLHLPPGWKGHGIGRC
jgi:hypothetical protein